MTRPGLEQYLTVGDFMDARPIALRPDEPIVDGVRFLLHHKVTGAPVVDEGGRPLGILGERDCLRLLTEGERAEFPTGTVRDYMRTELQAVTPDMNIYYVAGLFLQDRNWANRRFVVVDGERLVGVLTRYDVLRAVEAVHEQQGMGGR